MKLKLTIDRKRKQVLGRSLLTLTAALALAVPASAQAAPQWLTPQTISPIGYDANGQQVAVNEEGDSVAVWQSWGGANPVIEAAERPAGGSFAAPQTLSNPAFYAKSPDVAADAQGEALAVWLQSDGSKLRVLAAYRPAGGSFGAPQTLSPAGYEARDPRVAMNASGQAVIVWSLVVGVDEEVQAVAVSPGGGAGAAQELTLATQIASVPEIAIDAQGDATVVWDGDDGVNIRIEQSTRPAGGSFGPARYLSPAGDNADVPQIAFDAHGNALAVWRFDGSPASTIQAAYRPAGGEFGAPEAVSLASSQPAQQPQVAFDGDGDGVVVWQQSDGSELRIYSGARESGVNGAWLATSTLDPGGQEAFEPRIAGDGLSGTIVSWKTFNGIANSTQTAYRPDGASFTPATTISPVSPEEGIPVVGIDAQGGAIALWSRSVGANYLLEAAVYDNVEPTVTHTPTIAPVGAAAGAAASGVVSTGVSMSKPHCPLAHPHRTVRHPLKGHKANVRHRVVQHGRRVHTAKRHHGRKPSGKSTSCR